MTTTAPKPGRRKDDSRPNPSSEQDRDAAQPASHSRCRNDPDNSLRFKNQDGANEVIEFVMDMSSIGNGLLSLTDSFRRLDARIAEDMRGNSVLERVLQGKRDIDRMINDDRLLSTLDFQSFTYPAHDILREITSVHRNLDRVSRKGDSMVSELGSKAMNYWEAIGKSEVTDLLEHVNRLCSDIQNSATYIQHQAYDTVFLSPQGKEPTASQPNPFVPSPEVLPLSQEAPFERAQPIGVGVTTSASDLMSLFNVSLDMAKGIAMSRKDLSRLRVFCERLTAWAAGLAEWFLDQTRTEGRLSDTNANLRDLAISDLIELTVKQDVFAHRCISHGKDFGDRELLSRCQAHARELLMLPQFEVHATSVWEDYQPSAHQPGEQSMIQEMQEDIDRLFDILPMVSSTRKLQSMIAHATPSEVPREHPSSTPWPPPPPSPLPNSPKGRSKQANTATFQSRSGTFNDELPREQGHSERAEEDDVHEIEQMLRNMRGVR